MQLNDLLLSVPSNKLNSIIQAIGGTTEKIADSLIGSLSGTWGKIPRFELTERVKQEAVQSGLYHFVKDESVADEIIQSGHLRPSDNITSYGRKCVFMFCGGPSVDNYAKNLSNFSTITRKDDLWQKQINPYITPNRVATAIRITPQTKDLANYRFRGLQDGAFLYEGYCILPQDSIQKVKMVPDLVRDSSGTPIRDEHGEYSVAFREALPEELSQDGTTYNAKQDYLQYMKEKGIEYGYLHKDGSPKSAFFTKAKAVTDSSFRMESHLTRESIQRNLPELAYSIRDRLARVFQRTPSIEKSAEECLHDFNFQKKNPYRDKKFALAIAEFQQKDGLVQLDLEDVLSDFSQSKDGEFFHKKYGQLESEITRTGIHGKGHTNRVALQAMIIARNENLFENDSDDRIKDILATATMYHDIGRVLDSGPHARRGARKIAKMDLIYSDGRPYSEEDKKMVMALVEAHEGKPSKIDRMIKKYKIQDPNDVELVKRLSSVVRDADALDRVRIDQKFPSYKVNLNPEFLVNNTSKMLLNASYQLEFLTNRVPNINNILTFGKSELTAVERMEEQAKAFDESLKVNVQELNPNEIYKDEKSKENFIDGKTDSSKNFEQEL